MKFELKCISIGFIIAAFMLLTGCVTKYVETNSNTPFIMNAAKTDGAAIGNKLATITKNNDDALKSNGDAKGKVADMAAEVKGMVQNGAPAKEVVTKIDTRTPPILDSLSKTGESLIASLTLLAATKGDVDALNLKLDKATEDCINREKELASVKATAASEKAAAEETKAKELAAKDKLINQNTIDAQKKFDDMVASKDKAYKKFGDDYQEKYTALGKDKDAIIDDLKSQLKNEKSWWGRVLSGFLYALAIVLGLAAAFLLFVWKDPKLASQCFLLGCSIPVVKAVIDGITKSEKAIGIFAAGIMGVILIRFGFAWLRKAKGLDEVVQSMEIIKATPAITDENKDTDPAILKAKNDILKIQSDDTIDDAERIRENLKAMAAKAQADVAAKAATVKAGTKSWLSKLMFWKKG